MRGGAAQQFRDLRRRPEELATFYRELFGWRIERAEGVDYWRIAIDAEAAPLKPAGSRAGPRSRTRDG